MLIVAKHLYGATLEGLDGDAGHIHDILFDDQSWKIRHFVVNVDRWFLGKQVLIEPDSIERTDEPGRRLFVHLTKDQVRQCPNVDADLPVARRESIAAAQVLVWEAYWANIVDAIPEQEGDPHLRSTKMLTGLHLHCTDGQLGHVADFVVDDENWTLRDLVVDTRNWWPGKHVLVEPSLVEAIDWEDREIRLSLARDEVEHRPAVEQEIGLESPAAAAR